MMLLTSTLSEALAFAVPAIGLAWSFKIVRFPDLSADGTFVLGAFIAAWCCKYSGVGLLAVPLAIAGGALAGALCSTLNSHLKIPNLLCGILIATSLYSVNLFIMGGPNAHVPVETGVFAYAYRLSLEDRLLVLVASLAGIVVVTVSILALFLKSRPGIRLRAANANPSLAKRFNISTNTAQAFGLAISNGLVALGGALYTHQNGFASVTMGHGLVIHLLAALLLGEAVLGQSKSFFVTLGTVLIGCLVYKAIIACALRLGIDPYLHNLLTATVVVIALAVSGKLGVAQFRDIKL